MPRRLTEGLCEQRAVIAIDRAILVGIARDEQLDRIGARSCGAGARDPEQVDAVAADREQGERAAIAAALDQRDQAVDRRDIGLEGAAVRRCDLHADEHLAGRRRAQLRRPQVERQIVGATGRQAALIGTGTEIARAMEVRRERRNLRNRSIADDIAGGTGRGGRDDQPVRIGGRVAVTAAQPVAGVVRGGEVAGAVVGIDHARAVGRHDRRNPPGRIACELHRIAIRADDSAVAEIQFVAARQYLVDHTSRGAEMIDRAVLRLERVVGRTESAVGRVVRPGRLQLVIAVRSLAERNGRGFEPIGHARIGGEFRSVVGHAELHVLLGREGEAGALSIRQGQIDAGPIDEGIVDTETLAPGRGNAGLDLGIEIGKTPAIAERAGDVLVQRGVGPHQVDGGAAEHHRQIGEILHIGGRPGGRIGLHDGLHHGAAAAYIGRGQTKLVGAAAQRGRIEAGDGAADRRGAGCDDREIIRADQRALEHPAVQIAVADRGVEVECRGQQRMICDVVERDQRRGVVVRIADLEHGMRAPGAAVGIGGRSINGEDPGGLRRVAGATMAVERQHLSVDRQRQPLDRCRAGRRHVQQHGRARNVREARRDLDDDLRRRGLESRAQRRHPRGAELAVGHGELDRIVAGLRRPGRPGQTSGVGIERRSRGQAERGECELRVEIGVACNQLQAEGLADDDTMVADLQGRRTVDIVDMNVRRQGIRKPAGIDRLEPDGVVAGLLEARCPDQLRRGGVERRAGRQPRNQTIGQRIVIRVGRRDRELQLGAFAAGLLLQRDEVRRFVRGGDGDRNGARRGEAAVGGRQHDAAVLADLNQAGSPGQHARRGIDLRSDGKIGGRIGDGVAIGVDRPHRYAQGLIGRDGLVPGGDPHRRLVAATDGEREELVIVQHVSGVTIAAVVDGDQDAVLADIGAGRRPGQNLLAIDSVGRKHRAGRQAGRAEGQRILIGIRRLDDELERLADNGHLVSDRNEVRRPVGGVDGDDEGLRTRQGGIGAVAVAVIGGGEEDRIVAAVVGGRLEREQAGAVAIVDEAAEGRHAQHGQLERIPIGIDGRDRDRQHAVMIHALIGNRRNLRGAVDIEDRERDLLRGDLRLTGPIAIVGRRDCDDMLPGGAEAGRPAEDQRIGIEGCALRHAAQGVADSRNVEIAVNQGAVGRPIRRRECRIVGVEGLNAELDLLPFRALEDVEILEGGRGVDVEHRNRRRLGGAGLAVAHRERDRVDAVLRIIGRPGENAGLRIQEAAGRQQVAGIGERQSVDIACLQRDANRGALVGDKVRRLDQLRRLRRRRDHDRGDLADLVKAIAGDEGHIGVGARGMEIRHPDQRMLLGIEDGPRRQIVHPIDQPVAIRIGRLDWDRQGHAFLAVDLVGQRGHDRSAVHTRHVEREDLRVVGPARIVDLQSHRGATKTARCRHPGHEPGCGIDRHALRSLDQHEGQRIAIGVKRGGLVGVGLSSVRRHDRVGDEDRRRVARQHTTDAGVERDRPAIGIRDRDGPAGRRMAGEQNAIGRQIGAEIDQPGAVGGAAGRSERLAVKMLRGRQLQHQRKHQIVRALVGDDDVEGNRAGLAVAARQREGHVEHRGDVADGREAGRVGLCQRQAGRTPDAGQDLELVVIGVKRREAEHGRARRLVVGDGLDRDQAGAVAAKLVIVGIKHRSRITRRIRQHILVEGHRNAGEWQRDKGIRRRIGARHMWRAHGSEHVDLVRLAQEHPSVDTGPDDVAARPALGEIEHLHGRKVDHRQHGATGRRGFGVRHKQQAVEFRACRAEGDRADIVVEGEHQLRLQRRAGELDDLPLIVRPGDGPQRPVRRKGETAHTDIAEMTERPGRRVEYLDAVARRDIDQSGPRLQRQALGQRVPEPVDHGPGAGVEFVERSTAGRGPDHVAAGVEHHVVDRLGQRDERSSHLPAFGIQLEDLVARCAAADQHRAIGHDQDGHRPDPCPAGSDPRCEGLRRERREHARELGRTRLRCGRRDALLGLHEQGVGRRLRGRRRRRAEIRRRPRHGRGCAEIGRGIAVRHRGAERGLLAIAGIVRCKREEFVGVARLTVVDAGGLRRLFQPGRVVSAVDGNIDGDVLDAAAGGIIRRGPLHLVIGAALRQWRRGQ